MVSHCFSTEIKGELALQSGIYGFIPQLINIVNQSLSANLKIKGFDSFSSRVWFGLPLILTFSSETWCAKFLTIISAISGASNPIYLSLWGFTCIHFYFSNLKKVGFIFFCLAFFPILILFGCCRRAPSRWGYSLFN
jgi:hypothetical protein